MMLIFIIIQLLLILKLMNLTILLGDVGSSFFCIGLGKNIFFKTVSTVKQAADSGRHRYI